MKLAPLLTLSIALAGAPALTFANPTLAQQKNCMACHAAATKVVGPSYKDVAAKYAGQSDAAGVLSERIVQGSTGRWGFVPMPPNPQVTAEEARTLAAWILQQK